VHDACHVGIEVAEMIVLRQGHAPSPRQINLYRQRDPA
jgi:hypothetical protein